MKCTKCGIDNQANAKFCESCGTKLADVFPSNQTNYQAPPASATQASGQRQVPPPPPVGQPTFQAPPTVYPGNQPPMPNQYGQQQGQNFSQQGYPMQPQVAASGKTAQLGINRNVAGILCYAFGWISGLILFFIEKDDYVRFHAAQSVAIFGGIHVLTMLLGSMMFMFSLLSGVLSIVSSLISVGSFVLWILLMYKAYNGEYYKAPIVGDLVENFVRNNAR